MTNPRGQPRKSPENFKGSHIHIKVTSSQKAHISARAKASGLNLSQYVLMRLEVAK
jgi:uncharacterized protein (DUF1778 family)